MKERQVYCVRTTRCDWIDGGNKIRPVGAKDMNWNGLSQRRSSQQTSTWKKQHQRLSKHCYQPPIKSLARTHDLAIPPRPLTRPLPVPDRLCTEIYFRARRPDAHVCTFVSASAHFRFRCRRVLPPVHCGRRLSFAPIHPARRAFRRLLR